ncbi:hypothetical protein M8J75_007453, partial [Diaphorina citri]
MTAENMPVAPPSGEVTHRSCRKLHASHGYDPEYAKMEAWLDEHPDFVKATRSVVDAWLVCHATGSSSSCEHALPSPTLVQCPPCPTSRTPSGATTPVRKISAHEFERGGLLKPIVNTIDGTPTFLSPVAQCSDTSEAAHAQTAHPHHAYQSASSARRSRNELKHLDEKELIFELVKDICNELDVRSLCHKILQNVSTLLNADRGSLFLVQGDVRCTSSSSPSSPSQISLKVPPPSRPVGCLSSMHHAPPPPAPPPPASVAASSLVVGVPRPETFCTSSTHIQAHSAQGCHSKCLVSKLFDVCSRSTLQEMEKKEEIRIPWGCGIVGYVAESGEPVNIPDAYLDNRFNQEIDARTGYKTRTLLCMPIKDFNGDVIGVAQVINKHNDGCFTSNDEKVFASYLQFCGIGLRNAQLYEKSQLEVKRNQVLLDLARMIFEEQSTIEHMVFRILTHTQSLIQCQRVQVLLLHKADKGSFSRVFDFEASDLDEEKEERTSPFESRFPINIGVTGHVATTGETVNIV